MQPQENQQQNNNNNYSGGPEPISPIASSRPEDRVVITPVRTFAADIKQAIESKQVSRTKIALAEARRREEEAQQEKETDPTTPKNKTIIMVSFLLVVLGLAGFFGAFYVRSLVWNKTDVSQAPRTESIVPFDEVYPLLVSRGDRREVTDALKAIETKKYEPGSILVFVPFQKQSTSTFLTTPDFMKLVEWRPDAELARSFDSRFMYGYVLRAASEPFLILTTKDFDRVYAGMLEWEPRLANDAAGIFFDSAKLFFQGTSTTDISYRAPQFRDEVVSNRDIRTLRSSEGELLLFYTFIDDETVLLARDTSVIGEIVNRLATRKFKQ